jgi:hypothetical protein
VYLHHRYSLEGLIKNIGGMDFRYAMRGDSQTPTTIVPAAQQKRALAMALDALEPAQLAVPERILKLIPPVPPGGDASMAWLGYAGTALDQISLAGGLATETIEGIFERDRLGRLVLFHARDTSNPSLDNVVWTVIDRVWGAAPTSNAGHQALRRVVQQVVLNTMLDRAGDTASLGEVRASMEMGLDHLKKLLTARATGSEADIGLMADKALREKAIRDINRYFEGNDDPKTRSRYAVIPLPWP